MGIGMDVAPKVKPCPRHYGICVAQAYADWRHGSDRAVTDTFHGRQVVPDQLFWLIRKGDVILPDEAIVSTFAITCRFTKGALEAGDSVRVIFVATDMVTPPSSLSKLPTGTAYLFFQPPLPIHGLLCASCSSMVIFRPSQCFLLMP